LGNLPSPLWRQFVSARPTALLAAEPPKLDSGLIPVVWLRVFSLPCGDIAD
jgi:hypothetical protein